MENIFEELDTPNEWFYDENTRILYYSPNITEEQLPDKVIHFYCVVKWHQGTWAEKKAGIASCPKAYALPSGPVGLGRASGYCLGCRA